MTEYQRLLPKHLQLLTQLKKQSFLYSLLRLIVAIGALIIFYFYLKTNEPYLLVTALFTISLFLILLKKHQRVEWKKKIEETLVGIIRTEHAYLESGKLTFDDGQEFVDPAHPYAYDLDIFGKHSLFQHLNRTETFQGKNQLASLLTSYFSKEKILLNQEAVKELIDKVEWRNQIRALGQIKPDSQSSYDALKDWAQRKNPGIPSLLKILSFLTPLIVAPSLIIYFSTGHQIFWQIGGIGFIVNLLLLTTQIQRIKLEIIPAMEIDKILLHYALTLREIEVPNFHSTQLLDLQQQITEAKGASRIIHRLSILFGRMEHIQNVFASPLLNGLFLYHIHQLNHLYQWRKVHASHIEDWLRTIGEIETLNSLANFAFNNPNYAFPQLTSEKKVVFESLGHPLISSAKRVANSVSFDIHRFFVLTGSNMSGKSTFLRTLGINMVLTNIGAPVCAESAYVNPLPVLVSMRLSDSLNDSESYFFAEVKRLKEIMDALSTETCFVLLDEILRGTNSDDKRAGTVEVIKRMVSMGAVGVIATHDLEVCKTTNEFSDVLVNKRFEVEIVNNELSFDYKLRDGVCENKSATFLMEKMGVI